MRYRKLHKYKYQLMDDEYIELKRAFDLGLDVKKIETDFLGLTSTGLLLIKKGYSWDGPSGPTIDTPSFMRGSLAHDALYQLIRIGLLPAQYRQTVDVALRDICIKDGMSKFRAAYVYRAVRMFGGLLLHKDLGKPQDVIYTIPLLGA